MDFLFFKKKANFLCAPLAFPAAIQEGDENTPPQHPSPAERSAACLDTDRLPTSPAVTGALIFSLRN